jgi:hypothetical protein
MRKSTKLALRASALTATAALAMSSGKSLAQGWTHFDDSLARGPLARLPLSSSPLSIFERGGGFGLAAPGLKAFHKSAVSFDAAIGAVIRQHLVSPLVQLRITPVTPVFALSGTPTTHTLDVRYTVGGIPLHGFQARAHALADGGVLVIGNVPQIDAGEPAPAADWPEVDLAAEHAISAVIDSGYADGEPRVTAQERVLYVSGNHLLPAWRLHVVSGPRPFDVVADAVEALAVERGFFDVDGSGKVYDQNIITGAPTVQTFKNMNGDNTLASEFVKVVVPENTAPAAGTDNVFDFEPGSESFVQTQAYSNASKHFAWFTNLGFQWYGPKPLEVRLHEKPGGRSNNALFVPGSATDGSLPSITIDDGDGIDLQNLATDGDVVSHEFGHHVIYSTLRSTDGESLVLHEGLADFFAFSRAGDACLGESICPAQSQACIVPAHCLRTAELDLKYNDDNWTKWAGARYRLGHLHGQIISGMLWDMRKAAVYQPDELSALVFKAVSLFTESAGFHEFLLALLAADSELYGNAHEAQIRAAAEARGIESFFDSTAAAGSPGGGATTPAEKKESKGNENPMRCGVVAGSGGPMSPFALPLLALMLFAPLLVAARPALARVRARASTRRPRG